MLLTKNIYIKFVLCLKTSLTNWLKNIGKIIIKVDITGFEDVEEKCHGLNKTLEILVAFFSSITKVLYIKIFKIISNRY